MINLTINGKPVSVKKGTNIIDAAEQNGIKIPQLCYLKDLTPFAACRMCIVEIEGKKGVHTACSTLCREGMVVETETEQVVKYRKGILKLLMSNHPEDCLTCDAVGNCDLQELCYKYDVKAPFYIGRRSEFEIDDANPIMVRDLNKCIKCGKCVNVCDERQVTATYDFVDRGFDSVPTTAFNQPISKEICKMCGQCLEVCPTGALQNKQFIGHRPWELKKVRTTCAFCGVGCTLELNVKDDRIIGVTTVEDGAINRTQTCVKGRFGNEFVHSPERLTHPLIKENGEFREASWDEALGLVSERLKDIYEMHGSGALAGLASARTVNEDNFALQKLFRVVFGTNSVDHCARV